MDPTDNGQFVILPVKGDKGGWGSLHGPSQLLLTTTDPVVYLSYTGRGGGSKLREDPRVGEDRRTAVASDQTLPF